MAFFKVLQDLPPQVRDVLSIPRQEQFLAAYQGQLQAEPSEAKAYAHAWRVVLSDVFEGELTAPQVPDVPLVTGDGANKTVHITINAAEDVDAITMPPKLDRCVTEVMNRADMRSKYPDTKERKSHAFAICRASLQMQEPLFALSDLRGTQFAIENGKSRSWVQMFKLGVFTHPYMGPIEFTTERIERFAHNINGNIRGQQIPVDYDHRESLAEGSRAAGWIVEAEARPDGLWGLVDWTPRAAEGIRDGEYRYFSPEFVDEWTHPETGAKHQDVLLAGALTNLPFLKGMMPVNLGDVIAAHEHDRITLPDNIDIVVESEYIPEGTRKTAKEVDRMEEFLKKLAELLGVTLSEDSTKDGDAVFAKVKALSETAGSKLREEEKARTFAEMFPEEAKALTEQSRKLKEQEVSARLAEWSDHPKSHKGFPPKLHDPLKAFRSKLEGELATEFDAIMDQLTEVGTVDLSDPSRGKPPNGEEIESAGDRFDGAVKSYMDENKGTSYGDAVRVIAAREPDLARAWREDRVHLASSAAIEGGE